MSGVVRLEKEDGVGVIVIDNPPVNAGSREVRAGLVAALEAVDKDDSVKAAVLIGAGSTFISGSDIREFSGPLAEPQMPAVVEAAESCSKPVVAALHGASLGGGFEVALGCDSRIALPGTVVGFPECLLGIIPGAGGTVRAPRLTGPAKAIEIITSGRRIEAREALRLGLIDAVVEGDLRAAAIAYAKEFGRKRPLTAEPVAADDAQAVEKAAETALRKGRGAAAVKEAVEAVRRATILPARAALVEERATFQRLRASDEAAALRHLFFAERSAQRLPETKGVKPRAVERVGVVGGGTMGAGIAAAFIRAGVPVTLVEVDAAAVDAAKARVGDLQARLVKSGKASEAEAGAQLKTLSFTTQYDDLRDVDLCIEAVVEDLETKSAVMRKLGTLLRPEAIIASNTSYLDIDTLAQESGRPARFLGLHFFSPVTAMRLLEVVRPAGASVETLATGLAVAKRIGKLPVVAGVCEGFIGNRIYSAYRTQCELMLEEGALPEEVDAALEGFGFAMGPFAVGDLSGLDIAWRNRKRLAATRDPDARHPEILDLLCEMGRMGRKAGAGWYRYGPDGTREPDRQVARLIAAVSAEKGVKRRRFSPAQIVERALAAMVNEALLLLEEKVARQASDIDIVLVNGYGFPAAKGGALFWAGRRPRDELAQAMSELAAASGVAFRAGDLDLLGHSEG